MEHRRKERDKGGARDDRGGGANDFLRGLVSPAPVVVVVELQSDLVRGISNEPVEPLLEEEEEEELPAMVECEVL